MAHLVVWGYECFVCEGDGLDLPDPAGEGTGSFDPDLACPQDKLVWTGCTLSSRGGGSHGGGEGK